MSTPAKQYTREYLMSNVSCYNLGAHCKYKNDVEFCEGYSSMTIMSSMDNPVITFDIICSYLTSKPDEKKWYIRFYSRTHPYSLSGDDDSNGNAVIRKHMKMKMKKKNFYSKTVDNDINTANTSIVKTCLEAEHIACDARDSRWYGWYNAGHTENAPSYDYITDILDMDGYKAGDVYRFPLLNTSEKFVIELGELAEFYATHKDKKGCFGVQVFEMILRTIKEMRWKNSMFGLFSYY